MIEITELDELLNTLATSSLEPHGEYKMEFTNKEQKLIYEYIKSLQQENQQLKEQLKIKEDGFNATISELCDVSEKLKQRDEVIENAKQYLLGAYEMSCYTKSVSLNKENVDDLLDILKKAKGDSNE